MFLLVLTACDLDPGPIIQEIEPARLPSVEADEDRAPFKVPVGHCRRTERVRFSCDLGKERTVSVCEDEKGLDYRFGRPRAKPFELSTVDAPDMLEVSRRHIGNGALHILRFAIGQVPSATIEISTAPDREPLATLRTTQESGVKELQCGGLIHFDPDRLVELFRGDALRTGSWLGRWHSEDAPVTIAFDPHPETGELRAVVEERVIPLERKGGGFTSSEPCSLEVIRLVSDQLYVSVVGECDVPVRSGSYRRGP